VGYETTIPASERAKTVHALDRSATVTGNITIHYNNFREPRCVLHLLMALCGRHMSWIYMKAYTVMWFDHSFCEPALKNFLCTYIKWFSREAAQIVHRISTCYLVWRFPGVLTRARHWSISWARCISTLTTLFCKTYLYYYPPLSPMFSKSSLLFISSDRYVLFSSLFSFVSFQIYLTPFIFILSFSVSVAIFLFPLIYFLFYRASCFLFSFVKYYLVFNLWNIFLNCTLNLFFFRKVKSFVPTILQNKVNKSIKIHDAIVA
jgi:hypothetical protein